MPARRNSGVIVRKLPDWFSADMAGLHAGQGGVGGQLSEIGVYNNANDGTVLRVYALSILTGANTHVNFEYVLGKAGATWNETFVSLGYPTTPTAWGIPMAFTSAVCLGSHFGGIEMAANNPRDFAPGWPIAVVQPNWSWIMETNNAGITLECSWWYLQTPY
jgi:hypothetical protein